MEDVTVQERELHRTKDCPSMDFSDFRPPRAVKCLPSEYMIS